LASRARARCRDRRRSSARGIRHSTPRLLRGRDHDQGGGKRPPSPPRSGGRTLEAERPGTDVSISSPSLSPSVARHALAARAPRSAALQHQDLCASAQGRFVCVGEHQRDSRRRAGAGRRTRTAAVARHRSAAVRAGNASRSAARTLMNSSTVFRYLIATIRFAPAGKWHGLETYTPPQNLLWSFP